MELTGEQIIGFSFSRQGEAAFKGENPFTGSSLEPFFYESTASEANRAFQLARHAFSIFSKKPPTEKATFLVSIADEILKLDQELIQRCHEETALPETRLEGERGRTVNQLKLFAELLKEGSWVEARIDTALPQRQPLPKPDIRQMQIPLGPVGIFGASNFPLAFSVAGGDTASALAAGCPVVVKAHPAHPGTSEMIGRAIINAARKTGMPEGVFSMLHGQSAEVGMSIVNHPLTRAIGFTGSFKGGRALFEAAQRRPEPIPVFAEMGSVNPVFLLPGALKDRKGDIAKGLASSATLGVGQFCTKPGLVFLVQSPDTEKFINLTAAEISSIRPASLLTKKIKTAYNSGIETRLYIDGVRVEAKGSGTGHEGQAQCQAMPFLLLTTAEHFIENPILAEEVFGPATIIVSADDKDQLKEAVSALGGQLTATLHCQENELNLYGDLVELLQNKVGRLIYNGFPTGVEVCPSMHHGGPYPATTDIRTTSVGTAAIKRFIRPLCFQNFPNAALPDELKNENPLDILRLVNNQWTRDKIR